MNRSVALATIAVAAAGCSSKAAQPDSSETRRSLPAAGAEQSADGSPESPASKDDPPMKSATSTSVTEGIELSWRLSRSGDRLLISYAVVNKSDHRVYVCDKILVRQGERWKSFPAISLKPIREARDTVKLVVGTPVTEVPSVTTQTISPVLYKALEPGAVHEDSLELALPLATRDPVGMKQPLPASINKATLTVYAIGGEPPEWRDLAGDGSSFRVPRGFKDNQLLLSAGPLPLP